MATAEVKLQLKPGRQDVNHAAIEALKYGAGIQADLHRRARNVANFQRFRVGKKTGELFSTIRVEEDLPSVLVTAGEQGETPQLGYQIYGTKPHPIRPRDRDFGMLVFYWDKVGMVVHFKKVNHPGTRANRFVQQSVGAARG